MNTVISKLLNKVRLWKSRRTGLSGDKVSRAFRFRYSCFKDLLASNTELLNILTDFEEKLRGQDVFGMSYVRSQATRAIFHTLRMVKSLDDLSGHKYPMLFGTLEQVNLSIKEELGKRKELALSEYVIPYSGITKDMVDWVGGKNANLGELLNKANIPIPSGFAITTRSYDHFLEDNQLIDEINMIRRDLLLDRADPTLTNAVSENIQKIITSAPVPADLADAILAAYDSMVEKIGYNGDKSAGPHVALRSSAIGEDSELSYAGQYLSVLNVPRDQIVETYKQVIASLYTPRAISYRLNKGIRDEDIAMSVACIEMVDSVASGVIYSQHPFNLSENAILINAVWGLGPYAVDGIITPDTYEVTKDGDCKVKEKVISHKPVQLISDPDGGLKEIPVDQADQDRPCLSEEQIKTLAGYASRLEKHYQYPQDIEWALHPDARLLILQARPLHLEQIEKDGLKSFPRLEGYPLLIEGGAVAFPGVGSGPAFYVGSDDDLVNFPEGAVLVAKHSTPQFVIVMRKAQAIVTDAGSVTGHMASLAREFGVPALLNAKFASSVIKTGQVVTVDAFSGRVYEGVVPELTALRRTRESAMKDTPVFQTLRRVADLIVPLHLVNPRAANFKPESCQTIHDIMRFVHELSYTEMFKISDILSDTHGGGAVQLIAPIPLDLHIIDLGGGLTGVSGYTRRVTVDQVSSIPFKAVLSGMLHEDLRSHGPRAIDLGGFLSVMREQMLSTKNVAERFGDKTYAIVADKYVNFSSRIGYHYSVLDSYCGESVNKNYISFSFKGGAADEIRRNRRARAIALIFEDSGFSVDVREDRMDARYYKYEQDLIIVKLDMIGRMLQFTRQMDMLMKSEASVELLAKSFLEGNYHLDEKLF
jgi:pyruvate,water dikinase